MDKASKTMIRLMSVLVLCSINFFILLFFFGSNLFQNIINLISLNSDKLPEEEKNLYNLQYYLFFNDIYRFFYSITILAIFIAVIGVFLRLKYAGRICVLANICAILTSVIVIIARILESNKGVHKAITKLSLGLVGDDFVTARILPRIPVLAIIVIVIAFLSLSLTKSSNILKIKLYNKANGLSAATIFLTGMYGYIGIDVLRNKITYFIINSKNLGSLNALYYLRTYFLENNVVLNWPISYILIVIIFVSLMYDRIFKKKMAGILSVLIPSILTIIIIVINFINKPVIFGRVTMDLNICDMVDSAYYSVLVNYLITSLCLNLMFVYIISIRGNHKQVFILITCNIVLNIIGQLIARNFNGIAIHFIMWSVADFITSIAVLLLTIKTHKFRKKRLE
jgi:hypothetical protein